MHDTSWWQATLGTTSGGLGLKSSGDVCLPAFIGSRVAARALVYQIFKHAEEAKIGMAEDLQQRYDARTRRAVASPKSRVIEETHGDIEQAIAEGGDAAAARWRDAVAGRRSRGPMEDGAGPASARATGRHSAGLVSDAGAEDEEHPSRGISKSPQVQTRLFKIVDDCLVSGIERALEEMGAHCDLLRLRELRDRSTDHTWL